MKFRKIPVVIEAELVRHREDIVTLEGTMTAEPGDWIITGVKGERYPCKPDIFAMTYEQVEEDNPPRPAFYTYSTGDAWEVIGNIYENPELLEEKK